MKKKIFFVALVLFMVFLNSMILMVSIIILKDKLSVFRDKCLAEHYVIASSLIGDMQALEQRGNNVEENIDNLMRLYSRYLQGKGNGLGVAFLGEWIYESPAFAAEENTIRLPDTGYNQERLVYMENGNRPVLCVYGSFPAPWQDYGLMYMGDLSDIVGSWRHTKNILFLTGAGTMLVMSFFLFQFLNIIFRPLRQISSTSAKIANGNYGSRIPVHGKDEISSVAHNFNLMAGQVETQIRQLEDAAEQKQQFIDNFSHELRIPLTAIYGYAEYIQKALCSEEERYECTQFIMSECGRLQNMAYQLLNMALLGRDEMKDGDCSLKELFIQSEKIMHLRAAEKRVKLTYDLSDDYIVRGNMEQLLILTNNLIDNAIKASGQEEEIRILAYSEKSNIVVEVEDHGIGMEAQQVSHITEAFYRIDKARSRAAGGAGLGLAICEKIIRIHHADMSFISKPGAGTRVKLSFPV
ncbi:HAMP domain-containing sensor histidine kinase [Parablautia muri]|uniref:histidine kinase n=1 Tax=Parablautia muri TaxID=2320879 RepID=A0A9X5GU86_9FIRM|nr:HAMP domain-containing sensor histidine kinase [Parablautia muri]NBJ93792.1 sensor histidine kinase [Parablautia muri]